MAITGPSSYVPTTQEFITHWETADSTLGLGNEVVLVDGTTAANLQTKLDGLVAKRSDLQDKINTRETARGALNAKKGELRQWLVRFNEAVRADFDGTKWINALPDVPSENSGQGVYSIAFDDAKSVWTQLNADPGTPAPVTLLGGYDLATFTADVADLETAFKDLNSADKIEQITRGQRNALQDEIYEVLKMYRRKLPTKFAKDDPLVQTLPHLTPGGGHTPDAVEITVSWDDGLQQARIEWTESEDPNLASYEARFCVGATYSTDDEAVVGSQPPEGPFEILTTDGLIGPGSAASYKVYVMLTTGNEKGSTAQSVTWPTP